MNENNKSGIELLRELCGIFGPSGCEDKVADRICEEIEGFCDTINCDRMGNVIAVQKSDRENAKKIMLSAHMDEVGFMINEIDSDGYVKFSNVGGIDPKVMCGRNVVFENENGRTEGVIASKAIHHQKPDERSAVTPVDKMYIDIGAKNREDTEKVLSLGDYGTFVSDFVLFGDSGRLMKCKAIDDRLGCTVLIEVMRRLKERGEKLPFDVYYSFSVREEIGLSGAKTAAQTIEPDFAIVIESTAVADIEGTTPCARVAKLGEGGALSLVDRSTIYDREFVDFALACAEKNNIKVQIKKYVSGGNDAGQIHKSGRGVRTLAVSAPSRYIHSASCVAAVDDFYAIEELIYAVLTQFDLI